MFRSVCAELYHFRSRCRGGLGARLGSGAPARTFLPCPRFIAFAVAFSRGHLLSNECGAGGAWRQQPVRCLGGAGRWGTPPSGRPAATDIRACGDGVRHGERTGEEWSAAGAPRHSDRVRWIHRWVARSPPHPTGAAVAAISVRLCGYRQAVRHLRRHQRASAIRGPGDRTAPAALPSHRRGVRPGGAAGDTAARPEPVHPHGGGHRGCAAYRVRVQPQQFPLEGRGHRQDLFLAGARQDQTHGDRDTTPRERARPAQRAGDRGQVRGHGRRAGAWREHSGAPVLGAVSHADTDLPFGGRRVHRQVLSEPGDDRRRRPPILETARSVPVARRQGHGLRRIAPHLPRATDGTFERGPETTSGCRPAQRALSRQDRAVHHPRETSSSILALPPQVPSWPLLVTVITRGSTVHKSPARTATRRTIRWSARAFSIRVLARTHQPPGCGLHWRRSDIEYASDDTSSPHQFHGGDREPLSAVVGLVTGAIHQKLTTQAARLSPAGAGGAEPAGGGHSVPAAARIPQAVPAAGSTYVDGDGGGVLAGGRSRAHRRRVTTTGRVRLAGPAHVGRAAQGGAAGEQRGRARSIRGVVPGGEGVEGAADLGRFTAVPPVGRCVARGSVGAQLPAGDCAAVALHGSRLGAPSRAAARQVGGPGGGHAGGIVRSQRRPEKVAAGERRRRRWLGAFSNSRSSSVSMTPCLGEGGAVYDTWRGSARDEPFRQRLAAGSADRGAEAEGKRADTRSAVHRGSAWGLRRASGDGAGSFVTEQTAAGSARAPQGGCRALCAERGVS
eukprot:ctg_1005.g389